MDLTVTAPASATVPSSGVPDSTRLAAGGRRRWHAVAETARDVGVVVGDLHTVERAVGGTRVTIGALAAAPPAGLVAERELAIDEPAQRSGRFRSRR